MRKHISGIKSPKGRVDFSLSENILEAKGLKEIMDEVEKDVIIKVLKENAWNISNTAKVLKIPRQTLQSKIEKYKIKRE